MTDPTPDLLRRIAEALERLSPPLPPSADLDEGDGFVWRGAEDRLIGVGDIARVDLSLLQGIDRQAAALIDNTLAFAAGRPANHVLLWGARGTGKSSLVKAAHAQVNAGRTGVERVALVELDRDDIGRLPRLLERLRATTRRVILFCDDLAFDAGESDYKALKSLLDGGIEGPPANVVFYATSNRRHLLSRDMVENERQVAIHSTEAVEEKVSLSDRFGLSLGFGPVDQPTFFAMVEAYAAAYALGLEAEDLRRQALQWSMLRGGRSGRVAWQFIQHLRGQAAG